MFAASQPLEVVVIGGGLGGLCLAQGLKKANIQVKVYERDRSRTERLQGYRLYLNPQGSRALYNCFPEHLYNAFEATCGKPGEAVRILSESLEELLYIDRKSEWSNPIDRHRSVSRITLRELLLSGLDDVVHFNKTFTHYEETDGKVTAYFDDGTAVAGDILIGADGGNSRVRKQLIPDAKRADTGIRVIAGKVPLSFTQKLPVRLTEGVASVITPRGSGMFIARQEFQQHLNDLEPFKGTFNAAEKHSPGLLFDNTQSYVMWALCVKEEALGNTLLNTEALIKIAQKTCRDWHPSFRQMIGFSEPSTVGDWKIHASLPVKPWKTRKITLLGDAIHSMPPMGGTGSSMALQDAERLCRAIKAVHYREQELLPALHEYEANMLEHGFRAVQNSLRASQQFVADGFVSSILASHVLKVLNHFPKLKRSLFQNLG
jgi:2-polyprenyl-6-methoxyphenol hydroxylase-like FAD-dependent oxidoreductase